ncbi:MAG: hypothetical protein H0W68_11370 [Gemmatimonadaceae bacterium]|nr:hypothetical protein [Gemmatimonadaceae bacterium]
MSDSTELRRQYASPVLKTFGTLAELTLLIDSHGARDNGSQTSIKRT